eukprot:6206616-Pleurochrysis_carterae.AAC.1
MTACSARSYEIGWVGSNACLIPDGVAASDKSMLMRCFARCKGVASASRGSESSSTIRVCLQESENLYRRSKKKATRRERCGASESRRTYARELAV